MTELLIYSITFVLTDQCFLYFHSMANCRIFQSKKSSIVPGVLVTEGAKAAIHIEPCNGS